MKYLTVKQAAEECGMSVNQIKRACKNGELKASEVAGSGRYGWQYMIAEDDLVEWVENRPSGRRTNTVVVYTKDPSDMTVNDIAGEILNRIQEAYNKGYSDGMHQAKVEMLKKLNEV